MPTSGSPAGKPLVPHVHTTLHSGMESIRLYVERGFRFYTSGVIEPGKAQRLCEKFDDKYGVLLSDYGIERLRKRGHARARLVLIDGSLLYPGEHRFKNRIVWFLVATPGPGRVREEEQLQDAKVPKHKPVIGDFVLRKRKDRSTRTWMLSNQAYKAYRDDAVHAVRMKDLKHARRLVGIMMKWPHFAGVRQQRKKIFELMRKSVRKGHNTDSDLGFIPSRQAYAGVAKKRDVVPLGRWLQNVCSSNP